MKSFSELLSEHVARAGISDTELARSLGVRRQTIFRWREGVTARPRHRVDVMRLAEKLRLTPEERDQLLLAAGFKPESPPTLDHNEPSEAVEQPLPQNDSVSQALPLELEQTVDTPPISIPVEVQRTPTISVPLSSSTARPVSWYLRPWLMGSLALTLIVIVISAMAITRILTPPIDPSQDPQDPIKATLAVSTTVAVSTNTPTPTHSALLPAPAEIDETLILVTDFANYAGQAIGYNVAGRLVEALEREIRDVGLQDTRVEVWPKEINQRGLAIEAGQSVSATLVIYGEYDVGRIVAQFAYPSPDQHTLQRDLFREVSDVQSLSATINGELLDQSRLLALMTLGQIYINQDQIDLAQQVLEQAQRTIDNDETIDKQTKGTIYFYLGIVYGRLNEPQYNSALDAYSKALEARPNLISARLNRSSIYQARQQPGDLDAALDDISKVIALDADWAAAYNNRAAILMEDPTPENLTLALADLDIALELDTELVSAYINRANALLRQGHPIDVWKPDLQAALERDPNRVGALNMLCWGYAVENRADTAISYCEAAVSIDPRPYILDSRGLANALLGNTEQAIADFEAYIDWLETQAGTRRQDILTDRRDWVAALLSGENPFSPELLARLRNE